MSATGSLLRSLLVAWTLAVAGGIARAADAVAPVLSFSLRGVADRTAEQGEPLSVAVRLSAPRQETAVIEIAPSNGTWVDAVSVEIAKDKNAPVAARATAVAQPDSPRATLDKNRIAGGLWIFSSAAMQGLAPGDYVVRVRLKVEAGPGWKGEAVSNASSLKIVAPSSEPRRVTQRTLSRANEAMLANRGEEAAGILDAGLKTSPDDRDLLVLRAVVAERAGNLPAALLCVNRASRGLSPNGPPPRDLHELRTRLQAKLTQPLADRETFDPPAWSWPPLNVVTVSNPEKPSPGRQVATPASTPVVVAPPSPAVSPVVAPPVPGTRQPASAQGAASAGVLVPPGELAEAKILAEAAGQWAATATAGSQYSRTQYSAAKATGAPDIEVAGNSPDAWCPAGKNEGIDWLEVSFAKPVHATEVRVRQNDTVGAIAKIEAIEPDGTAHVWWEGVDPFVASATRDIVWFAVRVPKTDYFVAKVKITLNLAAVTGWKEIDAVQLVAGEGDK